MNIKHTSFSVWLFSLNLHVFVVSQLGSDCVTPNGENAFCFPNKNCEQLIQSFDNSSLSAKKFFNASLCGPFNFSESLVCCGLLEDYKTIDYGSVILNTLPPSVKIKELLPEKSICGRQGTQDKIFGGNETNINEFPWMALLEYRNRQGNNFGYNCGGVLISFRYVLTAAHCVAGNITKRVQLFRVRLGEHDILSVKDCVTEEGVKVCADPVQDFFVEEIVVHENFVQNKSGTYNDIALLRLAKHVNFTEYIKPICLPLEKEKSNVGDKLFVAGWGLVELGYYSPVKLKVDLQLVDFNECAQKYSKLNFSLTSNQICALGDLGKDSCSGDSGGPLMRTFPKSYIWYVEGLVSFGPRLCGQTRIPGVYSYVTEFIDWIVGNIRE